MILALCWLTISIPFVYASQQALAKQGRMAAQQAPLSDNDEETTNPFGNNTEEKAPTGSNSLSEEYLHDCHTTDYFFPVIASYHKCENAGTYVAFHGELDVPPPDQA
ncbi:MAG: hypothetical protein ABW019_11335 [Chitinophagaceae bacterium]